MEWNINAIHDCTRLTLYLFFDDYRTATASTLNTRSNGIHRRSVINKKLPNSQRLILIQVVR